MRKFIVLKMDDIKDHLNGEDQLFLGSLIDRINVCREAEGKAVNNYVVINRDEPYINEVTDIMRKHGHWEGTE
ncbi:hypothetical protein ABES35_16745 [Bacillus subtilis]|uniref:hypothetical protein n=1 Tax=Bacillus subtilis TaxID=1423 RepID=UPI000FFDF7EF|nr:hypothetical protein [Bacillus subtilis]WIT27694.1 hypothetical protein [Bacillus phage SPbetaL5]MEC2403314.1 hypothetical protein [Bacillus subtilis]MED4659435.1 hypothetical protein [Bacillus subtilis]MED4663740.1 hypothetical protein [Bacillus subtilis]NCT24011.1 hypothetical protein [Bacillus subtilis subsp. subtilis]